jgi:2-amino-4-hydroxy-6-hydroxymethyldihydropteridine diphosphokinase
MRTGVALGSNIGDQLANLRAAREAIVDLPQLASPILSSALYETDPVDCEPGAEKFLNAVIEFEYGGDPNELLERLSDIEESLGRERNHPRPPSPRSGAAGNVSRKIDIDLLYCGERKIDNERLQLPHPRMHLRKFVLQPLTDIQPKLVLPNQTESVRELLAQVDDSAKVMRLLEDW